MLVNARHGHLYGSHLLAEVATAIGSAIPTRTGWALRRRRFRRDLSPETGEAAAVGLAKRVRSAVCEGVTETLDGPVEASIGVAEWSPGLTAEDPLHAAVQALSTTKERGGATVISAGRGRASAVERQ